MKKLLAILPCIIFYLIGYAQYPAGRTYPIPQSLGSDSTIVTSKGGFKGRLVNFVFTDTTAANLQPIKNYPAAQIATYNLATSDSGTLWLRNGSATKWLRGSGSIDITSLTFLNDTTGIICFSNGVCDTFSLVNNNVFLTVNNAFGGCNNLLSGGVVTAANPTVNLVMDVTAADYTIQCKSYHTDVSQVTLADGDATFGRFDVIIVDTNEVVSVIQGTPSANPQVPQIDPASQLSLTTFLVPAGATKATDLGITQTVIYDENLQVAGGEWDSSGVSWTRDFANTSFPAHLTKDLFLSGSTITGSQIEWTTTDTMRNGQFDVFKFYIRLTDAWNSAQGLDISFYHGSTKVTNSVLLQNNSYGFNQATTGSYQIIAIPMASWVFTDSIFFSVVIKPIATPFSSQAFRLDWVQLQGGINQALGGSSGLYIWNQYSLAQPANYWIAGNAKVEGQITSPNILYSGSEKYGIYAIANGVEATVLGAYARATAAGAISIGSQAGLTGNNGKGITISQYGTTAAISDVNIGGLGMTGIADVNVGINGTITGNYSSSFGQGGTISHNNANGIGYLVTSSRNNEFILSPDIYSIEARGITRYVAGYVLTDSLGDGSYWVPRPAGGGYFQPNQTSTGATSHDANYKDFAVSNLNSSEYTSGVQLSGNYTDLYFDSTLFSLQTHKGGIISAIIMRPDSIQLAPSLGKLNIDTLQLGTSLDSVMVWNKTTGKVGYRNASSFGISGITADNGLTASTATNVQWGSSSPTGAPLLHDSYMYTNTFAATILGVNAGTTFSISNQHGSAGQALDANADNGVGASIGTTNGTYALFLSTNPASTNSVQTQLRTDRLTQGTAADGIGQSFDFGIETATGTTQIANQLISKWTTAAAATRTSQFIITGVNSAVTGDIISFEGNKRTMLYGRLEMQQGADVASVAGAIAVGLDGNVFELTGTNAVTLISNLNFVNGSMITFVFTSTATLTDGTANSGTDIGMELAGNANFVGSADDVITLVLSEMGGVQRWREVSRSVN